MNKFDRLFCCIFPSLSLSLSLRASIKQCTNILLTVRMYTCILAYCFSIFIIKYRQSSNISNKSPGIIIKYIRTYSTEERSRGRAIKATWMYEIHWLGPNFIRFVSCCYCCFCHLPFIYFYLFIIFGYFFYRAPACPCIWPIEKKVFSPDKNSISFNGDVIRTPRNYVLWL